MKLPWVKRFALGATVGLLGVGGGATALLVGAAWNGLGGSPVDLNGMFFGGCVAGSIWGVMAIRQMLPGLRAEQDQETRMGALDKMLADLVGQFEEGPNE